MKKLSLKQILNVLDQFEEAQLKVGESNDFYNPDIYRTYLRASKFDIKQALEKKLKHSK